MRLLNYLGESTDVDVDLDDPSVLAAHMLVLSGDEVLSVLYRDGSDSEYDSIAGTCEFRQCSVCDDSYIIVINGRWFVDKDAFMSRRCSCWRWKE